jgi:hypothetical protein
VNAGDCGKRDLRIRVGASHDSVIEHVNVQCTLLLIASATTAARVRSEHRSQFLRSSRCNKMRQGNAHGNIEARELDRGLSRAT